MEEASTKHQA